MIIPAVYHTTEYILPPSSCVQLFLNPSHLTLLVQQDQAEFIFDVCLKGWRTSALTPSPSLREEYCHGGGKYLWQVLWQLIYCLQLLIVNTNMSNPYQIPLYYIDIRSKIVIAPPLPPRVFLLPEVISTRLRALVWVRNVTSWYVSVSKIFTTIS